MSIYRDGNDGPWSTFDIHVGTPPQRIRVLASTMVGETWVVSTNGGCSQSDPSDCPQSRGGLVDVTKSSTWSRKDLYQLGAETNLPDYGGNTNNGTFGFDALGIGPPNSGGIVFKSQNVAAITTKSFFIGTLGLSPNAVNFTGEAPSVSFLSSLKQSNSTPSLSYAYTAGARYRESFLASQIL